MALSSSSWALEPGRGGYLRTGESVRVLRGREGEVRLYAVAHEMKHTPRERTGQAVVDAEVDKRVTLRMLEDASVEALTGSLRDAYLRNGYTELVNIRAFLGAFQGRDLRSGSYVTVVYDAAAKTTTVTVQGGGTCAVEGVGFMRATWNVWFGKTDQPGLAEALLARLPRRPSTAS